jgi:uncharacterized protein YdaU (DUF1376 family)
LEGAAINYYQRHLGDLARDTAHLTALEFGVYNLLMDWYYANERPIPDAQAHRYGRTDRATVELILEEFFDETPDGWQHKRIEAEIAAYNAKAEKNREVGKLGGRPKPSANHDGCRKVAERLPSGSENETESNPSHKPIANNHNKSEELFRPADAEPLPDRFPEFWQAYPNKTGRKPCAVAWRARRLDGIADEIIANVCARAVSDRKWLDGFIPNPLTYLNQERWKDPIQERSQGPPKGPVGKQLSGVMALLEQANGSMDSTGDIHRAGEIVRLESRRMSGVGTVDYDRKSLG